MDGSPKQPVPQVHKGLVKKNNNIKVPDMLKIGDEDVETFKILSALWQKRKSSAAFLKHYWLPKQTKPKSHWLVAYQISFGVI